MLNRIWTFFSELGIDPSLPDEEARRIRLLNRLSFVALDVLLLYLGIEIALEIYYFVIPLLIMCSLIGVNFYFMVRGWYSLAKYLAVFIMTLCIGYFSIMVGEMGFTAALFIPLMAFPLVIFKPCKTSIYLFFGMLVLAVVIHILQNNIGPQFKVEESVLGFFRLINIMIGGTVTFLLTYFFKKENELFEQKLIHMNAIVADKNKEIIDSIFYARHIQRSILPAESVFKSSFNDSFILYQPKDIVAGDFYFFEELKEQNLLVFAVCDCTGHGVPGALVSVVCSTALTRSVKEFQLKTPGEILDKTRELVIESFSKSTEDVKDGMDISLCVYDKTHQKLFWSGANNPLWMFSKSKNAIVEYKGDKQPVGKHSTTFPFTTHNIPFEKGDTAYLITDGFADQFGGKNGKKFKYAQLKDLLIANSTQSLEAQKSTLTQTLESWKGSLEQVDDVCILGVQL